MWKSIAWSTIGQYRQIDQYMNGPFIIQLMLIGDGEWRNIEIAQPMTPIVC